MNICGTVICGAPFWLNHRQSVDLRCYSLMQLVKLMECLQSQAFTINDSKLWSRKCFRFELIVHDYEAVFSSRRVSGVSASSTYDGVFLSYQAYASNNDLGETCFRFLFF